MLLENECGCHMALTIERQLKNYAECNDHTERHEILWHEWNHNKRWLAKIQQLILPSFPAYSMHDASHAEAVLHNIEMILGEENVSGLSATDCFVILHTVYVHDIGMCITHADRQDIIKDEKFLKYLENLRNNGEAELRHYADVLLQECFESGENLEKEKKRHTLNKKLEIYYAVTYLLAEYRRMEHGDISKERLVEWIDAPDKLGAGFSAIEIPRRLFYVIANCANTHTKWDFQVILKSLHQEDTGFAHDYVHPRFIAILLQLGDALDMDNGRFHPLVKEYMGRLPKMSETHYEKHRAIRRLRITNQKISISADCESQDVLRQVRRECDGIRSILKEAAYYWSVIRPKELNVGLPTFEVPVLLLKGNMIPSELVETKFLISQDKAFNLLKGNNIYTDENFVFLRELLQNAVDATKLQYFRDCKMQQQRVHKEDFGEPTEANKLISPEKYPIEIEFAIARSKDGSAEKLRGEKLDDIEKQLDGYDCGVLVSIQDYGIGIGAEDIIKIADVGTSYENRKAEIEKMPSWLQPTGTFGIGLQSVFLAGDKLTATTYSHQDIPYQITFYPRQGAEDGYINVLPLTESEEQMPYGTCFQLFVPNSRKKLHSENPETWDGLDPFDKDYDRRRQIRHSIELMKQMALYLTEMVGEPLFPIRLSLETEGVENERKHIYFTDDFKKLLQRSDMDIYIDDEEKKLDAGQQPASWIYYMDEDVDNDTIYRNQAGDTFRLDCEKAKLYVWNREYSAYACLGIRRILSMREQINNSEQGKLAKGVEIFYKGIRVAERFFRKDANLVEYIDLKQTLDSSELKLNRNGFSREGDKHLDEVYEAIVAASRKALIYFGTHKTESESIQDRIITRIKELLTAKEEANNKESLSNKTKAEEVILSAVALAYFAMLDETDDLFEDKNKCDVQLWKKLLDDINSLRSEESVSKEIKDNMNVIWGKSTLYSITLYTIENNVVMKMEDKDSTVSVLDIIDCNRKYAVISIRDKTSRFWRECLVELGQSVHKEIKEDIKKLRSMSDLKSRKGIMDNLYRKAERFLYANFPEENREVGQLRKEGAILKWILNNVPTMALFSTFDGNIRMNVLDMEVCNSVYFDENMRALTIERIREKFKDTKISRFSTIVWSGYRYLGVAETRASIQSVKRGKISSIGNCEMVFPLTGEELEDLNNKIERQMENLKNETKAFYESITKPILKYFESIEEKFSKDNAFTININSSRYWKELCGMLLRKDKESPNGKIEDGKEKVEELSHDDCERFVQSLNRNIEGGTSEDSGQVSADEENKKVNQAIVRLKRVWGYRGDSTEAFKLHEYCETEKFRNLVSYTVSNARMRPSEQQVETLYYNYICEVKDIMWMSKEKTILKDFDKDFAKALIERVWSPKESKEE